MLDVWLTWNSICTTISWTMWFWDLHKHLHTESNHCCTWMVALRYACEYLLFLNVVQYNVNLLLSNYVFSDQCLFLVQCCAGCVSFQCWLCRFYITMYIVYTSIRWWLCIPTICYNVSYTQSYQCRGLTEVSKLIKFNYCTWNMPKIHHILLFWLKCHRLELIVMVRMEYCSTVRY